MHKAALLGAAAMFLVLSAHLMLMPRKDGDCKAVVRHCLERGATMPDIKACIERGFALK